MNIVSIPARLEGRTDRALELTTGQREVPVPESQGERQGTGKRSLSLSTTSIEYYHVLGIIT